MDGLSSMDSIASIDKLNSIDEEDGSASESNGKVASLGTQESVLSTSSTNALASDPFQDKKVESMWKDKFL